MKGKDLKNQIATIELKDGNTYKIEFSLNAIVELEELFGDLDKVQKIFNKFKTKQLRGLLYCGLIEHHPDMTERKAGSLLDFNNMAEVVEKLVEAFTKAFPEDEGNAPTNSEAESEKK